MTGSEPRDRTYVAHMLEAIARIRRYVGRRQRVGFLADTLLQDAVIRNIEIIGEAAGRLSPDFAARHANVPWRDIVGMRHRLIHGYLKVNLDTVWAVVERDLPALAPTLSALLDATSPPAIKKSVKKPRALRSRFSRDRVPTKRRRA